MALVLWQLGAILCHDCRAERRAVDPFLARQSVEAQQGATNGR